MAQNEMIKRWKNRRKKTPVKVKPLPLPVQKASSSEALGLKEILSPKKFWDLATPRARAVICYN